MIRFFYRCEEYTTRARLHAKYPIPHTTLQELLQRLDLLVVADGNRHYYPKAEVEAAVERHLKRPRNVPGNHLLERHK